MSSTGGKRCSLRSCGLGGCAPWGREPLGLGRFSGVVDLCVFLDRDTVQQRATFQAQGTPLTCAAFLGLQGGKNRL